MSGFVCVDGDRLVDADGSPSFCALRVLLRGFASCAGREPPAELLASYA